MLGLSWLELKNNPWHIRNLPRMDNGKQEEREKERVWWAEGREEGKRVSCQLGMM